MKKTISLLIAVSMLVVTLFTNVYAYANNDTISCDGTWKEFYYNSGDKYVDVVIPSDGDLTVKIMHYMYTGFAIKNEDMSQELAGDLFMDSGSNDSPATDTFYCSVSKGIYHLVTYNGYSGKYKLSVEFKPYNNNENEPNDFENAMYLPLNQTVTGAFTYNDDLDWYKIYVPCNCEINIKLILHTGLRFFTYIEDLSETVVDDWYNEGGTLDSPSTTIYKANVKKGYYYIKLIGWSGKYKLSCYMKLNVPCPDKCKTTIRKTNELKLSWSKVGDVTGYQLQRKSGDTWKTITNTTSNSYTVSSLKSGTKYDFRVRSYIDVDGTKYYSGWKTHSTPTKPNTPSIKTPTTNKNHQIIVKWNKVSAGTGYQVQYSKKKNFSSVIATKTVSGISKTGYTGKNFTKGKTYYVRVCAYKTVNGTKYYGAWSKVKSIKCK